MTGAVLLDAADFSNEGTPATPASGWTRAYTKSDNGLYLKDSGGAERKIATTDDWRMYRTGLMPGVIDPANDGKLSSVSINAANGKVTYTLTGSTTPEGVAYVRSAAGPSGLDAVAFANKTATDTLSAPASGFYRMYLLALQTNGTTSWFAGTSTNVSADAAMARITNLVYTGLAIGWVIVQNVAGTYNLLEYGSFSIPAAAQRDSMNSVHASSFGVFAKFGDVIVGSGITVTLPDVYFGYVALEGQFPDTVTVTAGSQKITVQPTRSGQVINTDGSATGQASVTIAPGRSAVFRASGLNVTWTMLTEDGMRPGLNPGVLNTATDGRLSGAPTCNAGTGAITLTLGAANPCFVDPTVGGVSPVDFTGYTGTVAPGALPGAGAWRTYWYCLQSDRSMQVLYGASSAVSADKAMELGGSVLVGGGVGLPLCFVTLKNTAGVYSVADYGNLLVPAVSVMADGTHVKFVNSDSAVDFGVTVFAYGACNITMPDLYRLFAMSPTYQVPAQLTVTAGNGGVTLKAARSTQSFTTDGVATQSTFYLQSGQTVELMLSPTGATWFVGPVTNRSATAPPPSRMWRNAAWTAGATGYQKVPLDTISYDAGGNCNVANGRYVCPVAGWYHVDGLVTPQVVTGQTTAISAVFKNGSEVSRGARLANVATSEGVNSIVDLPVSDVIQCNAGDYLELYYYCDALPGVLSIGGVVTNYLTVTPIGQFGSPSPGQGLATAARATRSTNAIVALTANTPLKVTLDAASFDPGSNWDVANGRFRAPTTGYYQVNAVVFFVVGANAGTVNALLYKNGSGMSGSIMYSAATQAVEAPISDILFLQAGDYVELYAQASMAGVSIQWNGNTNLMSMVQVGGTNLVGGLSPTAQTADYAAGAGQCVLMTGAHTITLPNGPQAGSQVMAVALTADVTVNRGGADTINVPGRGGGNTTLVVPNGTNVSLRYLGGVWYAERIVDDYWTGYTSTWAAQNSPPALGSGGAILAYYKLVGGKTCLFRINVTLGTTGLSGGTGYFTFSLPFTSRNLNEQDTVTSKIYCPTSGLNFGGYGYIGPNTNVVIPYAPIATNNASHAPMQSATSGGAAGTGVPQIAAGYPIQQNGNMYIGGQYEIA